MVGRGFALAIAGVLLLTPDTLFMRLSGFDGYAMLAWRGLLAGAVFLGLWAVTARAGDLRRMLGPVGLGAMTAHGLNNVFFTAGIVTAPVAVVLVALATTPIWAALLSRLLLGEPTRRATWVATALVLLGVGVAVSGDATGGFAASDVLTGGAFGLVTACLMGLTFVLFRMAPDLPVLLCMGLGALAAGTGAFLLVGPGGMAQGQIWAIVLTGAVILPFSFLALSKSTRMIQAANVSLILLLETVLGPLWVWWGVGEAPNTQMWIGGAIVVTSLTGYILWAARGENNGSGP